MQHATGNFPGQLAAAQQSLDLSCLPKACATQTLPVRDTNKGGNKKGKWLNIIYYEVEGKLY